MSIRHALGRVEVMVGRFSNQSMFSQLMRIHQLINENPRPQQPCRYERSRVNTFVAT
jgi:hypothetical protein